QTRQQAQRGSGQAENADRAGTVQQRSLHIVAELVEVLVTHARHGPFQRSMKAARPSGAARHTAPTKAAAARGSTAAVAARSTPPPGGVAGATCRSSPAKAAPTRSTASSRGVS